MAGNIGGDGDARRFLWCVLAACLALLGLWLVVVQLRLPQWQASEAAPAYQRASYGIALHFALPGLMSLLALVDTGDPAYWRTSFEIIALGGVVVLITLRGLPGRPGTGRGAGRAAAHGSGAASAWPPMSSPSRPTSRSGCSPSSAARRRFG